MLKEFAVDPEVISSSWDTCRYLISQFGVYKGRLISKYPRRWKRMAFEAAHRLPDGIKKERVIESINGLNEVLLSLVASGRPYDKSDEWLNNVINVHQTQPFHAIICKENDVDRQLLDVDACDQNMDLFVASRSHVVKREANGMAQCAYFLLKNCRQLRFVDPYFDPNKSRFRDPLSAFLALIPNISQIQCEYHYLERQDSPPAEEFLRRLRRLKGVIPEGGSLRIVRWRERDGGERFHARYLLTENAGLNYEGGLDIDWQGNHTTDVTALEEAVHNIRWNSFNLDSTVYELVEPVLIVDSAGGVVER